MQVGSKHVKKVLIGSDVVYQDSDGWVPLKLPDGIKGNVLFHDNDDGTASLIGHAIFTGKPNVSCPFLIPPSGYRFKSDTWTKAAPGQHAIFALSIIDNKVVQSGMTLKTEYTADGYLSLVRNWDGKYSQAPMLVQFNSLMNLTYPSELLMKVNIEKV